MHSSNRRRFRLSWRAELEIRSLGRPRATPGLSEPFNQWTMRSWRHRGSARRAPGASHSDGRRAAGGDPATKQGAIARAAEQLGMHPETLRKWVRQPNILGGARPGTTTSDAQPLSDLEREVRELLRGNTILRQASA